MASMNTSSSRDVLYRAVLVNYAVFGINIKGVMFENVHPIAVQYALKAKLFVMLTFFFHSCHNFDVCPASTCCQSLV